MLLNEQALVAAARRGDTAAFRTLVEHHERPVLGFLYRLVGDAELARDLAQDAFLAAWLALPRQDKALLFRPWLFKIALNCGRHALRRRRLITWLPWPLFRDSPTQPLDLSLEAQAVHEALAALPVDLRAPLVLRLVQGFGYAEISSIMGISEAAVRMRLVRARREFKRIFTGLNAERPDEQSLASAPGGEP